MWACLIVLLASPPTDLAKTQAFYQTRPPMERAQAGWQAVPKGLPDLRATTCGACHTEIYAEWKVSTHGQAWTDKQFEAERAKSENRWLCAGCHTPLLNQMKDWPVGLSDNDVEKPHYVPNPNYDAAFQDEGITCAACHVRDGAIEGPTGLKTPAHPTRKAERFLNETLCTQCHQANRKYPGKQFECVFDTGKEWAAGPYGKAGQPCQSCHMQPVVRPQAVGAQPRAGRRHYWPGAGIYKQADVGPPLDQLPPGLSVTATGDKGGLTVTLTNANAGHMLPTGDPERFVKVTMQQLAADGRIVHTQAERVGQIWEWWPAPKKLGDTRLAPRESRTIQVPWIRGAHRWVVVAKSHRISESASQYHHLEGYPAARETHRLTGLVPQ